MLGIKPAISIFSRQERAFHAGHHFMTREQIAALPFSVNDSYEHIKLKVDNIISVMRDNDLDSKKKVFLHLIKSTQTFLPPPVQEHLIEVVHVLRDEGAFDNLDMTELGLTKDELKKWGITERLNQSPPIERRPFRVFSSQTVAMHE